RAMISPFFHDLNATTGTINYATTGSAPNRKFIVNFNNVADRTGGGTNAGQIVLYETSNIIEMFITKANTASGYSLVCGIQDNSGTYATTIPGQNNANYVINNSTAGTGYRFIQPSYSYAWSPASSLSSTTATSTVSSGLTSTQVYTVTTVDANSGCTAGSTNTTTVNVYTLPAIRTIAPATGCTAGTNITLDSTETGVSYQLYRGGVAVGSPVTGTGGTIHFDSVRTAGTYTIVGTLTTGGCTSNMSGTCVIYTSPTAIAVTGGTGCSSAGVTVGLGSSESGVSYQLFRGSTGLSTASGTGSAISFGSQTTAGTYTIVGTGTTGGCTTTMTGIATVNASPVAYSVTGGNGCSSTGVTVGVSNSETGVNYRLYRSGSAIGSVVAGSTGSAVSFGLQTTTGEYTVVATSGASCSTQMTGADTISTTPDLTIGAMPSVCGPTATATISFTGVVGAPTTYDIAWGSTALGAGFTDVSAASMPGSSFSISLPSTARGTFNGTLTISNGRCGSSGYGISVTVYDTPRVAVTSADAPCMGRSTNVVLTGTTGATVSYRVNGGTLTTATLTGGTYSIATASLTDTAVYLIHQAYNPACATTLDSTVYVVPVQMAWNGGYAGSESDWSTPQNWTCGYVPTATDNVLIPTGTTYLPIVGTGTAGVTRNIDIRTGATVTVDAAGSLSVKGDLINNGAVRGAGMLSLNGGTAHHISGYGIVATFELNDAAGATIDSGARMTVKNTLNMTAGTLNTNDSLVLASDSSATAIVPAITTGAVISGKTKVMQYIPGGYRRYRFWSHPFAENTSLAQVQNYIDVTGVGGASNGFTTTGSNAPSVYRYNVLRGNSALTYDPGWTAFTSAVASPADSNLIHRYQGIRIFLRGAKGEGLGYAPYTPSAATIGQWGTLNQGTQLVTMTKGTGVNQDYNIIGNPYACPVDIGTVVFNANAASRIAGSVFYVWDPYVGPGGQFRSIAFDDGAGSAAPYYIGANTAVEVRTANNGDQLVFNESNKGTAPTDPLLRKNNSSIALSVLDASNHLWDLLDLKFNDVASNNEDTRYDAIKLKAGELNFYSISADEKALSVDARPYKTQTVIPLGITSNYTQQFTIKADNVNVPDGGSVYLHDILLDKYVLLQSGTSYSFSITKEAATQGENRFELRMAPAAAANTAFAVNMTPNPAIDEVKISFKTDAPKVSVRIMDMSGVAVYHDEATSKATGVFNVPLNTIAPGIYMVEVTSGDHKFVQRLVKE
ncbi:MAG: T9SS C-terminal target domain-containing protein, partial [Chitinophagia bacterium]|nr:T9SS C-terminal target domain-containing protein [Chitinophagia bacterium]